MARPSRNLTLSGSGQCRSCRHQEVIAVSSPPHMGHAAAPALAIVSVSIDSQMCVESKYERQITTCVQDDVLAAGVGNAGYIVTS